VVADLARVTVFCDGTRVADHERVWAWQQTITDPEHRGAANMLRHNRIGAPRPVHEHDDQLAVDRAAPDTGSPNKCAAEVTRVLVG
jgi:Mu transposase-like protein